MSKVLPANRVAAIAGFLTGIGAAIAGIENALPSKWQDSAIAAVGVIGSITTVLHFMSGSQKFDALQTRRSIVTTTNEARGQLDYLPAVPVNVTTTGFPVRGTTSTTSPTSSFEDALDGIDPDYSPEFAGHPDKEDAS